MMGTAAAAMSAIILLPPLNGCASERATTLDRAVEAVGFDSYRISGDGNKELVRFQEFFASHASDPQNSRQVKHFRDAFKRIRVSYVEAVPDAKLIDAAIEGVLEQKPQPRTISAKELVEIALDAMTETLDPHSAYLNPEELREAELVTSGEFGGLGLQVTQEQGKVKVISPIEGTPADRAGIKPGDIITHLDGKPVDGMSLRDAVNAMRGEPGTQVRLTISRERTAPQDYTITRAIITIEPVRWRVENNNIGYLRVVSFNERTADAVGQAMLSMTSAHRNLRGLVIDLRNNPGGLLDQSLDVADDFLDDGTIVTIRGRDSKSVRSFQATSGDLARNLPIVVMINGGSASASEIVAAALQDHARATIVGTRSFGKGSVQTVMRLPVEGALKLTTALYYGPSGEAIQARGVVPDISFTGLPSQPQETHEADLPRALQARSSSQHSSKLSVDIKECPEVGEAKDRELGCAISLLQAGSTDRFMAALSTKQKM